MIQTGIGKLFFSHIEEKEKMGGDNMILLQSLLNEGEVIAEYIVAGSYCVWNCITTPGNTDIAGALEDTLHRILENGGTEDDVQQIMGAHIPTDDADWMLEDATYLDLGYLLPGPLLSFTEQPA